MNNPILNAPSTLAKPLTLSKPLALKERFAEVLPAPSSHEVSLLTENIRQNGCLLPILVWNDTIIDGHVRYHICCEYGIPFKTEAIDFNSDAEAIVWIVKNQIGRRNVTTFQRCELAFKYEPEIMADVENCRRAAISEHRRTGVKGEGQCKRTAEILADLAGVGRSTMNQVKKILLSGDEETKRRLRAGEISIVHAYRTLVGKLPTPESMNSKSDHDTPDSASSPNVDTELKAKLLSINETVNAANENVKRLIELVEAGDATPNVILQELRMLNGLLEEKIGKTER